MKQKVRGYQHITSSSSSYRRLRNKGSAHQEEAGPCLLHRQRRGVSESCRTSSVNLRYTGFRSGPCFTSIETTRIYTTGPLCSCSPRNSVDTPIRRNLRGRCNRCPQSSHHEKDVGVEHVQRILPPVIRKRPNCSRRCLQEPPDATTHRDHS